MSNEWLVQWFGEYVWDLRILSRRFDYAHLEADLSLLAPDWRDALCDRHALWPFDLMGVRASGYPGVFDRPAPQNTVPGRSSSRRSSAASSGQPSPISAHGNASGSPSLPMLS